MKDIIKNCNTSGIKTDSTTCISNTSGHTNCDIYCKKKDQKYICEKQKFSKNNEFLEKLNKLKSKYKHISVLLQNLFGFLEILDEVKQINEKYLYDIVNTFIDIYNKMHINMFSCETLCLDEEFNIIKKIINITPEKSDNCNNEQELNLININMNKINLSNNDYYNSQTFLHSNIVYEINTYINTLNYFDQFLSYYIIILYFTDIV